MKLSVLGVPIACRCGCDDLVLIKPGSAPVFDPATQIMLERGEATSGTCLACWPAFIPEVVKPRRRARAVSAP